MRIGIISDIHGNFEALSNVISYLQSEKLDQMICLGDVVGYGASPNECCELVRKNCAVTLLGNHDAAVIGAMEPSFYYEAARETIYWTRKAINKENYEWLFSLPYTHSSGDLGFFHSAPVLPSGFFYCVQSTEAEAHLNSFKKLKPINFIGHSHLTTVFALSQKKVKESKPDSVTIKNGVKFIVNVGSVGQPRDKNPESCFGIYDTDEAKFSIVRLEYDIESAARKVIEAGLDERFAKRLFLGV